ncbi:MAG: hypothetical protein ACFKPT_00875 [Gloeotrichia echinulata GP01]
MVQTLGARLALSAVNIRNYQAFWRRLMICRGARSCAPNDNRPHIAEWVLPPSFKRWECQ